MSHREFWAPSRRGTVKCCDKLQGKSSACSLVSAVLGPWESGTQLGWAAFQHEVQLAQQRGAGLLGDLL